MPVSNHAEAVVNALGLRFHDSIFPTRWSVLNHLFCTIGNGFDWRDGKLIEKLYPDTPQPDLDAYDRGERVTFHAKPPKTPHGRVDDNHCYPLSKYSALCCIPDNVEPCWLALAREVIEHVLKLTPTDDTKSSIEVVCKVKHQLTNRFDKTLINRTIPS